MSLSRPCWFNSHNTAAPLLLPPLLLALCCFTAKKRRHILPLPDMINQMINILILTLYCLSGTRCRWMAIMACVVSNSFMKKVGQAGKKEKRKGGCVCYYTQYVCVWCCRRHFPSARHDVAREQFQDHSDIGRAGWGVVGGNIESMLPPASECRVIVWCRDIGWEHERMVAFLSFIFFSPLLSFHLSFFFFLFPLLTAVIVSFSLSKNIVVLPWCKGGEISTCVLPFHLRGGERGSWGKSGVLMTAECVAWVMLHAGICCTCIKLFTSKTHCLLPARAAGRGGRMMEKRDELNIRKMECLWDGKREEQKGVSKDKKRGGCLDSKDVHLSFGRREVGLK